MQDNTHFRLMAQAVGDQAKLRRLKEQEERMSEPEPNTDEIRPPIYGLMAALAETNEHLKQLNAGIADCVEHLGFIRSNTFDVTGLNYKLEIKKMLEQAEQESTS